MQYRNRIKELRYVAAGDLRANPKNWRKHPSSQRTALKTVLKEVGIVDAVLARETEQGLELIDGHLRTDVAGDQQIPVIVVDLDESEADIVLATFDPLTQMASADGNLLSDLISEIDVPSLESLLKEIGEDNGLKFDEEPAASMNQPSVSETFQVLVDCRDEAEQLQLLERLSEDGYECRALIA